MTIGCLAKDVLPALVSFGWDDYNNVTVNAEYVTRYPTIGNSAGTYCAVSQVTVSAHDWRNFQPFYCKAEHVDGAARVVRQTSCTEPEMIIRAPRLKDFENSGTNATIVCMAVNLHTTRTRVQWLKNGRALDSGVANTGPVAVGPSGYSIISELKVDRRDWVTDKTFSCEVRNENFTSIRNISKSLVCDLGPCSDVQVHVETIPPAFTDIYMTKSAKLTCRISNVPYDQDLKELEVIWTRERGNTELETTIGRATAQENNELIFVDATATVCPEEWDSGETFTCKVTIPSLLPTAETRTLRKLKGGTPRAPAVYVLPPPSEQLNLQETATITCLLKGFYPNEFFVKWLRNDEPVAASEYFTSQPIQESKSPERYFTYSTLNVKEQDWSYGATYTCMVGHEALPLQTTQKTVDKNTAYLDGMVAVDDDEGLLNISSTLSTFIILFLISLFYGATVTVIKEFLRTTTKGNFTKAHYEMTPKQRQTWVHDRSQISLFSGRLWFEPQTAPVVFPLSPCCEDTASASQVSMGCLISGYFPEPVTVQWNSGAISSGIKNFPALLQSSSGHYFSSSQLTVPGSRWQSQSFQCNVEHAATSTTINKEIEPCSTHKSETPDVQLLHSSCSRKTDVATIQLVCLISGFYPRAITVNWLVEGKPGLVASHTDSPRKDETGETFSTTSTANVTQLAWKEGKTYTCQVIHDGTTVEKHASKCPGNGGECTTNGVKISITPPNPTDLYMNGDPKLVCSITGLDSDVGLNVRWTWEKTGDLAPEPLETTLESDDTFTSRSSLIVSKQSWLAGDVYTCIAEHPSFAAPLSRQIAKKTGKITRPHVYLYRPHNEELKSRDPNVSLTCLVKGFNPEEISIRWLENHIVMGNGYVTTPVQMDNGQDSFFIYSKLTVPKANWNDGSSYTCHVVHEGLEMKYTQRTIEKIQEELFAIIHDQTVEKEELDSLWTTILIFFILFLFSICYSATVTLFKVKWLFSTVLHLKNKPAGPEYKNVIQEVL